MSPQAQSNLPATTGRHEPAREPRRDWRRDPAQALQEMQSDLAQFLGLSPLSAIGGRGGWLQFATPRVDIFERDGSVVVKAELPGIRREDVELAVEDGDLVIRAHQEAEKEIREEAYYRMERRSGDLYRRLPLPEGIASDKIDASLKDGVLEVTVPLAERRAERPHRIAIR